MSDDNRDRARFMIYAVAGAYLLYLAWQIFQGLDDAEANKYIMIAAIIAFTLIGGAAFIGGVYVSIRQMKTRYDAQLEYETRKAQQSEEEASDFVEETEPVEANDAEKVVKNDEVGEASDPAAVGEPDEAGEDVQNAGTEETVKK